MAYSRSHIPSDSIFNRNLSKSQLNSWQSENLQMDDHFATICGQVVNKVVLTVQREIPWTVEKVVLGGSLGKGTAIRGDTDADCVMFLGDFVSMDDYRNKLEGMIETLNARYLRNTQEFRNGKLKDIHKTPFASQFTLNVQGEDISVDLLPAYDNLGKKGARNTFQEMNYEHPDAKKQYRSSLASLQLEFVKSQPPAVKNLIRLVKYWRKTCLPKGSRYISSYPLELITIKAWEEAGRPSSFDLRQGFKAVAQVLVNYPSMNVAWPERFGAYVHKKHGEPFILDPGNPHNNVAASWGVWSEVASYAHQVLQSNLLQGVRVSSRWD